MNRKITNKIRFFMDECIPAVIRDSYWFMYPLFYIIYRRRDIRRKMDFKTIAYTLTENELNNFYSEVNGISRNRKTDLSESNIRYILRQIPAGARSVVDIGCDRGFLLNRIHKKYPALSCWGVDLENRLEYADISFNQASITRLPFPDNHFDVVICTHTIEHIIALPEAIAELIRITRGRLIVVTPCQRYFYYTLDGHVNFFLKEGELLRHFPLNSFYCRKLDMDWIYVGNKTIIADPGL